MGVLATCKNEEDPFKKEGTRVVTKDLPCKYMKMTHIQAFIVVLLICKNEEDPFILESTRMVTTFLP